MNWYYAENNERKGPLTESEFDWLVHEGKITPATLVWNEKMTAWSPWSAVRPAEPPPPAPAVDPAATLPAAPIERDGPAWEHRSEFGFLNAAKETVKEVIFNPRLAFSCMKREGGWFGPLGFAMLVSFAGNFTTLLYQIIRFRLMGTDGKGPEAMVATNTDVAAILIVAVILLPIFIPLGLLINSIIIHGVLSMFGFDNQRFETTWRVVCYSVGAASAFLFVPICGSVFFMVFNFFALTIGIARAHEISAVKSIMAISPLIFLAVCILIFDAVLQRLVS